MNWMQKDVQTSAQMEIAWQCAPVLTGVKPSNILTLKRSVGPGWNYAKQNLWRD